MFLFTFFKKKLFIYLFIYLATLHELYYLSSQTRD